MYCTMFDGMENNGWTTQHSKDSLQMSLLIALTGGPDPELKMDEKVMNHLMAFMVKHLEKENRV